MYVGAVACRLEKREGGGLKLYIMTLGVLAPYRRLGIGETLNPSTVPGLSNVLALYPVQLSSTCSTASALPGAGSAVFGSIQALDVGTFRQVTVAPFQV